MEPLCFPGEEGIHSCLAVQVLIKECSNILGSLLSPFMTLMENALVFGAPAGAGYISGCSLGLFVHYLHFGCKSQRSSAKAWKSAVSQGGIKFHPHGEEFGSLLGVCSQGERGRLELQFSIPFGSEICQISASNSVGTIIYPIPHQEEAVLGWEEGTSWMWNITRKLQFVRPQ